MFFFQIQVEEDQFILLALGDGRKTLKKWINSTLVTIVSSFFFKMFKNLTSK